VRDRSIISLAILSAANLISGPSGIEIVDWVEE
jgi:hypothetical protein